ncbi:ABC transporter substrate-binding protein [Pirellulales bacterium]|nr:ABC transporter substrate-binding protein [Pirellulales bacterium]
MELSRGTPIRPAPARPTGYEPPATVQLLPEGESRQCPYCSESISIRARKCWRCHEHFSLPTDDIDERAYQFARREVLQDCVVDIKKWIARLGFGSIAGIALVALLSTMRFQDMLEDLVAERVHAATGPVLSATEQKLGDAEDVMDDVEDKMRLAKHRIAQFDWIQEKLSETESTILQVEDARQGLETRAAILKDQFGQLEHRFLHAKRELRNDRDRRVDKLLSQFSNRVLMAEQLHKALAASSSPACQQVLAALGPLERRQIDLVTPVMLATDQPTVLFANAVRMEWHFPGHEVGEVNYRVSCDVDPSFQSARLKQSITRLTNYQLPPDFPRGPVYWRVEALDRDGSVHATSKVGYFERYVDSIDRIRSTGTVRVGVAYSAQGEFAYFDEQHGRLTGFDIELSRWLASRLLPDMPDVQPIFVNYNWRQLFDSVSRNEADFVISTITITPEREEEYALRFSQPYYRTAQACVVLKESGIRTVAQMHGRRLAVQSGTSSEPVGEAFTDSANLYRAASSEAAFDALLQGQVDAVITDYDFAQGELRNLGPSATAIAIAESDFPANYRGVRAEEYGIAVARRESNLLNRLNNAIETAARANVLESLKLQFVTGNAIPESLMPLPSPGLASPRNDPRVAPSGWLR